MLLMESTTQVVVVLGRMVGRVVGLVPLRELLGAAANMAQKAPEEG